MRADHFRKAEMFHFMLKWKSQHNPRRNETSWENRPSIPILRNIMILKPGNGARSLPGKRLARRPSCPVTRVAALAVSSAVVQPRGHIREALLQSPGAPRGKNALLRPFRRRRHCPRNRPYSGFPALGIDFGNRLQKTARVWVRRTPQNICDAAGFDHAPGIHHCTKVCKSSNKAKIMRDKQK